MNKPGKKRPLKKRIRDWLLLNVGPVLTYYYIQLVGRTSKWIAINNEKNLALLHRGHPYIAALWHNRVLMAPFIFKVEGGKKVVVMVSSSKEGILTARILKLFGLESALGSSTRGGKEAMQQMLSAHADEGFAMTITPDGPLGPNEVVKMGVIALAKETGLPIVSLSYYAKKVTRLKSWDRFVLVWPFNTIAGIGSAERIYVPADADDAQMEQCRIKVEKEMLRLNRFVEDYFAGKVTLEGQSYFYSQVSFFSGKTNWTRPNGEPFTKDDLLKENH